MLFLVRCFQVANLAGDFDIPRGAHTHKDFNSTFGRVKGKNKKERSYKKGWKNLKQNE